MGNNGKIDGTYAKDLLANPEVFLLRFLNMPIIIKKFHSNYKKNEERSTQTIKI